MSASPPRFGLPAILPPAPGQDFVLGAALGALVLAALAALVWGRTGLRGRALACLGLASTAVVLVALLLPPVARVREAGPRAVAASRLQEIAVAMHGYADDHGPDRRLPPSVRYGAGGRPLHSWRVLLLPYLGEGDLFREFKLDEPWDSPHNLALLPRMPRVYAPPEREGGEAEPFTTFYQVFTGPGTAFEVKAGPRLPDDFPDGTALTVLVAEAGRAVRWTEPVDLVYAADRPLPPLGGVFTGEGRFRRHGPSKVKGFHVAFADGSVRFVYPRTGEATIRGAITRAGGEPPGQDG